MTTVVKSGACWWLEVCSLSLDFMAGKCKSSSFKHKPPPRLYATMIRRMSILLIFLVAFTSATSFSLSDRPTLKYGTAWKKEATADLVFKAVIHGFRRQCIVVMFELYS